MSFAEKNRFLLILPEMGKTLYESQYFPETNLRWNRIPGGLFLKNHLFPLLQEKFALLTPSQGNFLLGLSTGARGVVLTALENPGLFAGAAALSGDYDQMMMPEDKLMAAVYGQIEFFPERWSGRDNPLQRAAQWRLPLFLGHGKLDTVIPPVQTLSFYEELRKKMKVKAPLVYFEDPKGRHDFPYWDNQLPLIFSFFAHIEGRSWIRSLQNFSFDNQKSLYSESGYAQSVSKREFKKEMSAYIKPFFPSV